jgi:hypothetical protein
MLAASLVRLVALASILINTVMASECRIMTLKDTEDVNWEQQEKMPKDTKFNQNFDTYKYIYGWTIKPSKIADAFGANAHSTSFDVETSILKQPASINAHVVLLISSKVTQGWYDKYNPLFRIQFVFNQAFKDKNQFGHISYYLYGKDSCVAEGYGWDGHNKVPFFAEDITEVRFYRKP